MNTYSQRLDFGLGASAKSIRVIISIAVFLATLCYCLLASAATLTKVDYQRISNTELQISLQFSGTIATPKSFTTEQPARVILDFFDVDRSIVNSNSNVDQGVVTSLNSISANGRTRLIFDLRQPVTYQVNTQGSKVMLTLTSSNNLGLQNKIASISIPVSAKAYVSGASASHYIKNIDFKRNNSGGGDVLIDLSDANTVVNVSQQSNTITATLPGTRAPGTLQRRLDVTDFATPVKMITTQTQGNQTTIQIQGAGEFEQLAYQVNKQFVISVNPLLSGKKALAQERVTYTGKPISLNFQDIPIRSVLEILASFTSINIVAVDSVKGNITLRLNNIPWDEALDIILKSSGLGKKQVGNVIMVEPMTDLAIQEKQTLAAQLAVQTLEPLQNQYIRLNYAKASDVAALLKDQTSSILSSRGNATYDQRTNTVIVQDTPTSLINVQNLITKLDIPVQQVMIEARIVNVDTAFEQDLGIRWGLTKPTHVSGTITGANQMLINEQTAVVNPVSAVPLNQRLNVDFNAALQTNASVQSPSVGVALAELGDGYMLDLELSAIESEGGGELISSPRLVTANQHPALIQQGTEIPYQQATSSGATSVQFQNAVLSLRVTPQITPDNKIIMAIKVTQDKVNPTLNVAGVPAIDTREIVTNVLVGNGETIVLGGIYEDNETSTVYRVPFLGSIPILGYLFRNTDKQSTRTELLIFITPKIITQLPVE
ncbi:MAG: type IV pilus secretin PilQ [Legionellales bacterium]|nr:type IV pilus secretin PilQ [Legionellales bacterium]